jgi:inosose dehydratase
MTPTPEARPFGVDLITFFEPSFWGASSAETFRAEAAADPEHFWRTVLNSLQQAGVSQFEMTFAPADRASAVAAFGSATAFRSELTRRGLSVVSSYFGAIEHADDVTEPATREEILAAAARDAQFLADLGARYLVAGLPMRRNSPSGRGFEPVDLTAVQPVADLLNAVGQVTARHGVTLALHTESHSMFWTARDVDLFLLLTDPFLVAFCPDTGHLILGGSDPTQVVERHRDRVVLAHWKDASGRFAEDVPVDSHVFERHQAYFRPAGKGVMDWFSWARMLRSIDYQGGVLLELDAAPDPVAQLTEARTFLENVIRTTL